MPIQTSMTLQLYCNVFDNCLRADTGTGYIVLQVVCQPPRGVVIVP